MRPVIHGRLRLPILLAPLALLAALALFALPQEPRSTSSQDAPGVTIRSQSNLVLLRVIVRDSAGQAVSGLTKSDFAVLDNKKPQTLSLFSVETAAFANAPASQPAAPSAAPPSAPAATSSERTTALFFDDFHLSFDSLTRLREAASRYLSNCIAVGERVSVFTASGHGMTIFSNDTAQLQQALADLRFEPRFQRLAPCPNLSAYHAQLIDDGLDHDALSVGIAMTIACLCHGDAAHCPNADTYTENQARQILMFNDAGADSTLSALENLVRRMATINGERRIALVSDGFLAKNRQYRLDAVVDHALRAGVVISTMDARGLYALAPSGDASTPGQLIPENLQVLSSKMQATGMQLDADVLNYAAESTGGTFVENTNDLESGLARIAALGEPSYLLGFVPADLKPDGKFHTLTVKLTGGSHFTVQTRRGYYASSKTLDPAALAKEELTQAVFSHESLPGLPMEVHTQFFRANSATANVSIQIRTDVRGVPFRKQNGRNFDDFTLLVAIFDRDGTYVTSRQETANLHINDSLFTEVLSAGLPITLKFDLKPGTYLVRTVVRESNSQKLGATTSTLAIPD